MKRAFSSIFLILLICSGCVSSPVLISGEVLMQKTKKWNEPKVAIWHYMGSDSQYDYFNYTDLGDSGFYKVRIGEVDINKSKPFSDSSSNWVFMPWGPYSELKR